MESSPKAKRPIFQPYIPVHRRNQPEQTITQPTTTRITTRDDLDTSKRRGRGQFRAPSTEEIVTISNSSSDNSEAFETPVLLDSPSKDVKIILKKLEHFFFPEMLKKHVLFQLIETC